MSEQKIIHGDALDVLKTINGGSIDVVIADPPYNLGKDFKNGGDSRSRDAYLEFSRAWLSEVHRVLKSTGTLYCFMGFRFISYLYDILERDLGMQFNSWIVWHYTQGLGKTKGFSPRHDDILMFTKSKSYIFNLDNVRVPQKYYRERNNMRGANPGDVWKFSHVHYCNPNRQNHPTQKPEGLIERMVLASSHRDGCVLDPFAGSGTTLRVCQQLDRVGIGIELSEEYVQMIQSRLMAPFEGFDSVDPRAERVPLDLRRPAIRKEYLENHTRWFLNNHENALKDFESSVASIYPEETTVSQQLALLEEKARYGS